ncbi:helix-turn-helix domain-containing protein [Pseudomonas granadensis]|uniref:helix-turn-helix domain-containing protein n=1 Tax=Pseudomonas granadensis TaxID=1421430 RepID=UPI0038B64BB9
MQLFWRHHYSSEGISALWPKRPRPCFRKTAALPSNLGDRLKLARLRRKLTAKQVAERAGMSVMTLRSLETGATGVTIGAYVSVMQVLGLEQDLNLLASAVDLGRSLLDARLTGSKHTNNGKRARVITRGGSVNACGSTEQISSYGELSTEFSRKFPLNTFSLSELLNDVNKLKKED